MLYSQISKKFSYCFPPSCVYNGEAINVASARKSPMKHLLYTIVALLLFVNAPAFAVPGPDSIERAIPSPDGKLFVKMTHYWEARIEETESGKELYRVKNCSHLVFSPDGKKFVTTGNELGKTLTITKIFEAESGKVLHSLEGDWSPLKFLAFRPIAFSPDGTKIIAVSEDGFIHIWDVETGKPLKKFEGYAVAAFSPDGKKIVTTGKDGSVRILDAESGKELKKLVGHADRVNSAVFTPDGKKVITASYFDKTARIWDIESEKELHKLESSKKWDMKIVNTSPTVFSPDGKSVLIIDGDMRVLNWDIETGEEWRSLTLRTNLYEDDYMNIFAAFSPDGKQIMTVLGLDIRIWDVRTGRELQRLGRQRGR